jgi:Protein of unknown function, DUF547
MFTIKSFQQKGPFLGTDDPVPSSFRGLGDSAMVRSPKTVVDDFIYGVANRGKHKAVMGAGPEKSDSADRERDVEGRDRGHDNDGKEKDKEKDLKLARKEVRSNSLVDSFKYASDEKNGKEHQTAVVDHSYQRNFLTSCESVTTDSFTSNNSNSGNHANVATPAASMTNNTAYSKDLNSNSTPVHNPLSTSSPLVPSHVTEELPNDFMTEEVQALWIEFMDGVALLQAADASSLRPDSDDALCMFLNLYHLMVIHSSLVMGPPCSAYKVCVDSTYSSSLCFCPVSIFFRLLIKCVSIVFDCQSLTLYLHYSLPYSLSQWVGFFGCVSYEVFGDFISIAELEHCILRNGTAPSIPFRLYRTPDPLHELLGMIYAKLKQGISVA